MRRGAARLIAALLVASVSLGSFAAPAAAQPGALPPGFKQGARENPLRRFEIIAFGAFPIVLFYVGIGFDLARYASSGFEREYAPWPFKSDNAAEPDDSELYGRIAFAAGLSLALSGVDALLHRAKLRRALAPAALDEAAAGQPAPSAPPAPAAPAAAPELDSAVSSD